MKCWTFRSKEPGIRLAQDEKLGPCVYLGEQGRGRWLERVKLDNRNPPSIVLRDGKSIVLDAGVAEFTAGENKRYVLTASKPNDDRILADINSDGTYTRGSRGDVRPYMGDPVCLARGWRAWGDAGRIGTQHHGLWLLNDGDSVYVEVAGGYKTQNYVLMADDGELKQFLPEDYLSLCIDPWVAQATQEEKKEAHDKALSRYHKVLAARLLGSTIVEL